MPHDVTLITTIAAALGLALIMGSIAARLRLPPLVGYLIAGIIIGPATPGFVADLELSSQLAEIGVMLLMFGVGLHFSLDDLLAVRQIALPGAIVQILVATLLSLPYGAGIWEPVLSSALPYRWRVLSCCSGRWKIAVFWTRSMAASQLDGWWSKTW